MSQQVSPEIKPRVKSKCPLIALLLTLSSSIFCGIPIVTAFVTKDSNFLSGKLQKGPYARGVLVTLAGVVLGDVSLVRKDENKVMTGTAIPVGIIAVVTLAFAMFFFFLMIFMSQLLFSAGRLTISRLQVWHP